MRRLPIWAGLIVAALAVAVAAWVVLSPGWALGLLQQQLGDRLGRTVTAKGGAHLELAPVLAIRLDQVAIANPADFEGDFVTARALRLPVGIGDLLRRSADLSVIRLEGARFSFAVDEMGRANWSDGTVPAEQAGDEEPPLLRLFADDSEARFFDARSNLALTLRETEAAADISRSGSVSVTGSATVNERRMRFEAFVKSAARAAGDGSPFNLTIQAPALEAQFDGRLAASRGPGLVGQASLSAGDLRETASWLGLTVAGGEGLKDFSLAGPAESIGNVLRMTGAAVGLDGMTGKTDLRFDFSGPRPAIEAVLAAERFDLNRYLGRDAGPEWSATPWGFADLGAVDFRLNAQLGQMVVRGLETGPAKVDFNLVAGKLEAQIETPQLAGGSATAQVNLEALADRPALTLNVDGSGLDATQFFTGISGISWLSGGTRLTASLSASGRTAQEMISTLKGSLRLGLDQGAIESFDLREALAAVSTAILEGWPEASGRRTPFASLTASFSLADGIAAITDAALAGPAFTASVTGEIDLLRQALDLKADPRLVTGAAGETAGLPVAVAIKGPWSQPRIYPDMRDVLSNPAAAFETLKALGLPQSFGSAAGN